MHGGLSNPIHVHQLGLPVWIAFPPGPQHGHVQRLATKNHPPQYMLFLAPALRCYQLPERARRLIQNRHPFSAYQTVEIFRGTSRILAHYNQKPSMQQSSPYLPYRKVKGVRMKKSPSIILVKVKPGISGREQTYHIRVLH